jgi:hypothetical protein
MHRRVNIEGTDKGGVGRIQMHRRVNIEGTDVGGLGRIHEVYLHSDLAKKSLLRTDMETLWRRWMGRACSGQRILDLFHTLWK